MTVGHLPVLNIHDRFVQVLFRQIVDNDLTGTAELYCKSVSELF